MPVMDPAGMAKIKEAMHKEKIRRQMHHDLCLLAAGGANVARMDLGGVPEHAMRLYKDLWLQVMKEIP